MPSARAFRQLAVILGLSERSQHRPELELCFGQFGGWVGAGHDTAPREQAGAGTLDFPAVQREAPFTVAVRIDPPDRLPVLQLASECDCRAGERYRER